MGTAGSKRQAAWNQLFIGRLLAPEMAENHHPGCDGSYGPAGENRRRAPLAG
jgi:hypothetical protein